MTQSAFSFSWTPPCVGCGYCCRKVRCILGAMRHGPGVNCPSLVEGEEGRWRCQPVLEAKGDHLKFLRTQLSIGAGCCSSMNTDRKEYL